MSGAGDHRGIKTEEQAAECPDNRASPQVGVQSRALFFAADRLVRTFLARGPDLHRSNFVSLSWDYDAVALHS